MTKQEFMEWLDRQSEYHKKQMDQFFNNGPRVLAEIHQAKYEAFEAVKSKLFWEVEGWHGDPTRGLHRGTAS